MRDVISESSKKFYTTAFFEWIVWMVGSLCAVLFIKWLTGQYGAQEYELHIWVSATLYLWYVSTMSIVVGGTYFVARAAEAKLERRQEHPQKPENVDLTKDIERIKRIKKRAGLIAIIVHLLNAGFVFVISRHIPGITPEFRIYAVLGVFAIAAIKPGFAALNAIRMEIFGMQAEADYPVKGVALLWEKVDQFGDYETRLKEVFKEIENTQKAHDEHIDEQLVGIQKALEEFKKELHEVFHNEYKAFSSSDDLRQKAYNELRDAQMPITKEIGNILAAIQSLKEYVIELRDKNIKGEQLMSALKEFGIDSLADLDVSFQKSVAKQNPTLPDISTGNS